MACARDDFNHGPAAMLELAQIVAGWPLGASMAAAVAARGLRAGRRRTVLNEALHELRRPLQALALAAPAVPGAAAEGSVQMAAVALDRLDREINGRPVASARMAVAAEPLLAAAVGRWRAPATLGSNRLELRWRAGRAAIECDRREIAQALDNLIVNAIEHGGPEIAVEARICRRRLRVSVVDSGRSRGPANRGEAARGALARLGGRRRRGHGLRVVRRIAAGHGGEFRLRLQEDGAEAVLELPLVGRGREAG